MMTKTSFPARTHLPFREGLRRRNLTPGRRSEARSEGSAQERYLYIYSTIPTPPPSLWSPLRNDLRTCALDDGQEFFLFFVRNLQFIE
jgi:hypothetical protein